MKMARLEQVNEKEAESLLHFLKAHDQERRRLGPREIKVLYILQNELEEIQARLHSLHLPKGPAGLVITSNPQDLIELAIDQGYRDGKFIKQVEEGQILLAKVIMGGTYKNGVATFDETSQVVAKAIVEVVPPSESEKISRPKIKIFPLHPGFIYQDQLAQTLRELAEGKERNNLWIYFGEKPVRIDLLSKSVDELDLTVRTQNCLQNANIRSIGELVQWTEEKLLKSHMFGRKSVEEIKDYLSEMGLSLGMKFDWDSKLKKPK